MRDRRRWVWMLIGLALLNVLLLPKPALAYVGGGPEVQLLPYFLSLLVWVGLAAGAVLLWPIHALIRRLRGRSAKAPDVANETAPDAPGEGSARPKSAFFPGSGAGSDSGIRPRA